MQIKKNHILFLGVSWKVHWFFAFGTRFSIPPELNMEQYTPCSPRKGSVVNFMHWNTWRNDSVIDFSHWTEFAQSITQVHAKNLRLSGSFNNFTAKNWLLSHFPGLKEFKSVLLVRILHWWYILCFSPILSGSFSYAFEL